MNKKTLILIIIIALAILTNQNIVFAESGGLDIGNIYNKLFVTKNPFEPQIPKKNIKRKIDNKTSSVFDKMRNLINPNQQKPDIEEAKKSIANLKISGLIWKADRPQAIINNKVFDIGDTIKNMKIVAIKKGAIDISFNGEILTIKSK